MDTGKGYTNVSFRREGTPGARYVTGLNVYDEAVIDGRLVGRYWNACGQIWPEMHLPDKDFKRTVLKHPLSGEFPLGSFKLGIAGVALNSGWTFAGAGETEDKTGLRDESGSVRTAFITLIHEKYPIEVRVCTRMDGTPWLVRWLEITNRGESCLAVTSVYPMSGRLWTHRHSKEYLSYEINEVIPPSYESPFALAYNHLPNWGQEGDLWFEPLKAGETRFDGARRGKSGWSCPAFWLRNLLNGHTFVCEFAWSGNWDFSIDYDNDPALSQVAFAMGMSANEGEVLRVVEPGETVTTPAVHIAQFTGDDDSIVQSQHQHVRHVVMPTAPEGRDIEIEANHRGYLCDRENEAGIKNDIDVAAAIGAEMYVIDAGWYGNEPNRWWDNVGDWFVGPWLPNGLEPIVEHAHSRGMKFGLWMEFEAAGAGSNLRKEHPEWIMKRNGENATEGRALDLSKKEVEDWLESQIERLITQYKLDMFRIDHNHDIGLGGTAERHGYMENVLWRYYEALYRIFDKLRTKYPAVIFQNCAGGGGRLDLGILQRFHNTEISDWMRQPRGMKIFNGLLMAIPPEIGLRTFGTEVSEHIMESDLDFQMRVVCICRPIFRGIAPGLDELNPLLKDKILHHLKLYKDFLRPLMRDCLVYHHTPWQPVKKPAPWCVLEYSSADKARSMAAIFRVSPSCEESYVLFPRGIDRSKKYKVYFDNSKAAVVLSGSELAAGRIRVRLPGSLASELITFEEV